MRESDWAVSRGVRPINGLRQFPQKINFITPWLDLKVQLRHYKLFFEKFSHEYSRLRYRILAN